MGESKKSKKHKKKEKKEKKHRKEKKEKRHKKERSRSSDAPPDRVDDDSAVAAAAPLRELAATAAVAAAASATAVASAAGPARKPTPEEIAAKRAAIRKRPAPVVQTRESWEQEQSKVRRVWDPDTGRERLVRGSGEIIEEIVSAARQKEINAAATHADGATFQRTLGQHLGPA